MAGLFDDNDDLRQQMAKVAAAHRDTVAGIRKLVREGSFRESLSHLRLIRGSFTRPDFQAVQASINSFRAIARRLGDAQKRADSIASSGWLPHRTTPKLDGRDHLFQDADLLDVELADYYEKEWSTVRREFEESLEEHRVDAEAKAAFVEALDCHEAGFYRAVPRLLFPELERIVRLAWHDGDIRKLNASLKPLQEAAGGVDVVIEEGAGLAVTSLMSKMKKHMYVSVSSPQVRDAMALDPVPNRHACIHGYISYKTMKSSINALIMSDFAFSAVTARVNRHDSTEADQR